MGEYLSGGSSLQVPHEISLEMGALQGGERVGMNRKTADMVFNPLMTGLGGGGGNGIKGTGKKSPL